MGISSHRAFRPPKRRAHRTRTEFEPSDLQNVARAESAPNSNLQTSKTPRAPILQNFTNAPNRHRLRTSKTSHAQNPHRIRTSNLQIQNSSLQTSKTSRAPNSNRRTVKTSRAHRIRAEFEPSDVQNVVRTEHAPKMPRAPILQNFANAPNTHRLRTSKTSHAPNPHRIRTSNLQNAELEPSDVQLVATIGFPSGSSVLALAHPVSIPVGLRPFKSRMRLVMEPSLASCDFS